MKPDIKRNIVDTFIPVDEQQNQNAVAGNPPAPEAPQSSPASKPPGVPDVTAPGTDAVKTVKSAPADMAEKPRLRMQELYRVMNPVSVESEEDRRNREKREKWTRIASALTDGMNILANFWKSTHGIMPAKMQNVSAANEQRWQKMKEMREGNEKAWWEGYRRAVQQDRDYDDKERAWRHALEREKKNDAKAEGKERRAEAKERQDELMFQLKYALAQGKLDEQGYRTAEAEIRAGRLNDLTDARIASLNRSGKSTASGKPGEYPWYDSGGNKHYAHTYEAMRQNAIDAKTWNDQTKESVRKTSSKSSDGTKKQTQTVTTSQAKGYSAKPQTAKPAQEAVAPPPSHHAGAPKPTETKPAAQQNPEVKPASQNKAGASGKKWNNTSKIQW